MGYHGGQAGVNDLLASRRVDEVLVGERGGGAGDQQAGNDNSGLHGNAQHKDVPQRSDSRRASPHAMLVPKSSTAAKQRRGPAKVRPCATVLAIGWSCRPFDRQWSIKLQIRA